jgi:hypothetical protein
MAHPKPAFSPFGGERLAVSSRVRGLGPHLSFWQVGTSRCDVTARAVAGGPSMAGCAIETVRCAAKRGADGAARRPYQKLRCARGLVRAAFRFDFRFAAYETDTCLLT